MVSSMKAEAMPHIIVHPRSDNRVLGSEKLLYQTEIIDMPSWIYFITNCLGSVP